MIKVQLFRLLLVHQSIYYNQVQLFCCYLASIGEGSALASTVDHSSSVLLLSSTSTVRVHPSSSNRDCYCFCCSISYILFDDATTHNVRLLIQFWSLCCHCPCFLPSQILTRFDQASCSKCHFHHIHFVDTVAFDSFFKDPCNYIALDSFG